jgi:hypothetical protein
MNALNKYYNLTIKNRYIINKTITIEKKGLHIRTCMGLTRS